MFTGLIEEVGKVKNITYLKDSAKLEINCNNVIGDLKIGDSISVNGACLTAIDVIDSGFTADVMTKTLELTALANLKIGDLLNLELAMKFTDRFGGHLVQGHVDAAAKITEISPSMEWTKFQIELPNHLLKYVVPQGSICLDGVSLTIGEIVGQLVAVWLIPKTLEKTNLADKKVGDLVNVEVDLLAKYVERLSKGGQSND
ncbi:MAG: riboflavin synthase [Actinobacteria bacterium]|uniref:Riboflavin synthase n=1 Tax=freshwater metagenome TaxID=449393 RepID=A0A6J6UMW3_9ZZZZ|nr:riboflavin synthase [Actinomycetota bacterium]